MKQVRFVLGVIGVVLAFGVFGIIFNIIIGLVVPFVVPPADGTLDRVRIGLDWRNLLHTAFWMQSLLILAVVVVGVPVLIYLFWVVHCMLDRICASHARRFCRRHGLEVSRARWTMEFEPSGPKTEFTLVQMDCFDAQKQRRLVLLRVWPLGVRKMLSDEKYPESYDEQWPKMPNNSLQAPAAAPASCD